MDHVLHSHIGLSLINSYYLFKQLRSYLSFKALSVSSTSHFIHHSCRRHFQFTSNLFIDNTHLIAQWWTEHKLKMKFKDDNSFLFSTYYFRYFRHLFFNILSQLTPHCFWRVENWHCFGSGNITGPFVCAFQCSPFICHLL